MTECKDKMNVNFDGGFKMNNCEVEPKVTRKTAAQEIYEQAGGLAEIAAEIALSMAEKLEPLCTEKSSPKTEAISEREFPPYFAEMRVRLESIGTSLDRINDVIRRCDI